MSFPIAAETTLSAGHPVSFLRTKTKNALNTHMHSCGENYWKAMKGDQEKKRTFNKKKKKAIPSITLMGGDQTKNEVGYKKEQETATRNITTSGAGGEDFSALFY